ncbi:MAG: hypothetical protein OJF51_001288 [Nitrospira sp.]|nr:MAG: hypothetical protein OJF51_001288 [Nitrospira sp.]
MSSFPGSPQLLKAGLILLDSDSGAIHRIITLQYNPETLTRTLAVQAVGSDTADRSQALRLKGPPVETIKLEASIDATDQLEFPDQNQTTTKLGIRPQLAAIETIIYPPSSLLQSNNQLAQLGTLEIVPMQAPLVLFSLGRTYLAPVRITDFSIVEEAYDPNLNPILAKVSLGLRVLSIDDLDFNSKGGSLFLIYQQQKERFAGQAVAGSLGALGLGGIP